jgi:hypothetical protein
MLGVPTSQEDLVLMVAIPVGGFVVVKVGGMTIGRAAFLLRRARTVDDVVEQGRRHGFQRRYAADMEALEDVAGGPAAKAMTQRPMHVGAGDGERVGKQNPWNPSGRDDNCTACVAAVIHNSMEGYFKHSADELERLFGYVGRERQLAPPGLSALHREGNGASGEPQSHADD